MNSFPYSASVIIPNWNGMKWLPGCLDALKRQSMQDFEVIVVDNDSSDDSVYFIRNNYPDAKVIPLAKNFGFSVAVNEGIKTASGKYIVLLNNDTLPEKDWLLNLVHVIENSTEKVGSLASLMVSMDDQELTDNTGITLDWNGLDYKIGTGDPCSLWTNNESRFAASAGAALYRRDFFERTGLFDEKFGSYLEDLDLSFRGNLFGFSCVLVPSAKVLHKSHGSAISSKKYTCNVTKNRLMLLLKNIPIGLLIRHSIPLFIGQIHSFRAYKQPYSSLRGYWYVLWNLPRIFRERHEILSKKVLSNNEIDLLLSRPAMLTWIQCIP